MYDIKIQLPPGDTIGDVYRSRKDQAPQIFLDAMTLREDVFCGEQGCPLINELDEDDSRSWQWVFYDQERQSPIGVIRLTPPPHPPHPNGDVCEDEEPYIKLSRIAVSASSRGRGLAPALINQSLTWAAKNSKDITQGWKGLVLIHAQVHLESMYRRFGFQTDRKLGQWDEEGICHIGMWKRTNLEII